MDGWRVEFGLYIELRNEDCDPSYACIFETEDFSLAVLRSTRVHDKSDCILEAIQLYSLQFNYYYNTLFPFSINDLELIKSISSENLQAAGCLIVMRNVKFGNELGGEVSSKDY